MSIIKKILHINSKNRKSSSQSTTHFDIDIDARLLQKTKSVILEKFIFVNSMYNVNANNNTFKLELDAVAKTYTLTEGVYDDVASVITELNTQMTGDSITATYSELTKKITLTHASATIKVTDCTALYLLGFREMTSAESKTTTADAMPDLRTCDSIYVHMDFVGRHLLDSDNSLKSDVIAVIPMNNTNIGETINFVNDEDELNEVLLDGADVSSIHVQLTDKDGNTLLNNNMEWVCCITCYLQA